MTVFKSGDSLYMAPDAIFEQYKDMPLELVKFSNYIGESVWIAGLQLSSTTVEGIVAETGMSICFERLEVMKSSTLQLTVSDETRVEAMKNFYRSCESHDGWAIDKVCYNTLKKLALRRVHNL